MKKNIVPALATLFCSTLVWNCSEESPNPVEVKTNTGSMLVAPAAAALAITDKYYTDASGDVDIVVRTCDYEAVAKTGKHCNYCALDDGWVMIGGGAQIEGNPSSARLRGSFPFPNNLVQPVKTPDGLESNCTGNVPNNNINKDWIAWMARSDGTSSHRTRAYVIGMKIQGLTETQVAALRLINDNTSVALTQPSLESSGFQPVIGGGANEVGSQNCYLTESRPNEATNSWRGSAYCGPNKGGLKVYSITLNTCPQVPGWTNCMQVKSRLVTSGAVAGFGTATVATPYPWVTSSIGGKGVVNLASSRFLTDLIPLPGGNQGSGVTTKDQAGMAATTTTAYAVNIFGGRWGTWLYNSVRFNTAGTTLERPAGAAPVTLRQSTANPVTAPYQWYLEPLGANIYRLRNANPNNSSLGECAYRQAGTSNVLVGPCNATTAYQWTNVEGEGISPFKLKNLNSGTCLDNNNSVVNSNLRLAACVNGYSTRQSLFLDNFNWPQ
jgi:hypothetical protein